MKNALSAFALLCCCGCHHDADQPTQPTKPAALKQTINPAAVRECAQKDTTTAMGTRIRYLLQDGGYKIAWGDAAYQRVTDSVYTCEYAEESGLWSYVPAYHSETKNTLVFTATFENSSGGNPSPISEIALILPKNQRDAPYVKEFFLNSTQGYLLFTGLHEYKHGNEADQLTVQNLETKKSQVITLRPIPLLARTPGLSIRKTRVHQGRLYVTYEYLDRHDDIRTIEKSFHLSI